MGGISALTLIGLYPIDRFSEVGILRLVYMGGVPVLTIFILVLFFTLRKLKELMRKDRNLFSFVFGVTSFIFAFFVSLFNLPLLFNFSCMGMLALFLIIAVSSSSWIMHEKIESGLTGENQKIKLSDV